jgi:hypothetical protein
MVKRHNIFYLLITVLVFMSVGCEIRPAAQATSEQELKNTMTKGVVSVTNRNGSVDVIADDSIVKTTISVVSRAGGVTQDEADKRIKEILIKVTNPSAESLDIKVEFPKPRRSNDAVSLVVRIPTLLGATVKTSNGAISILDSKGPIDVNTSNGRVTVKGSNGNAVIGTSNGRITVERHSGDLSARTSNGGITVKSAKGRINTETTNGSISISLTDDGNGPITANTSNGSIKLALRKDFKGHLKATVVNGDISIKDPGNRITSETVHKTNADLVIGSGGENSELKTSNGKITIEIAQ